MAGLIGNLSRKAPPSSPADTIISAGWDRDLVEVPDLVFTNLSGGTEEQARAALYVDGGWLVIDTSLSVAAGAADTFVWSARLADVPPLRLGSTMFMGCEYTGGGSNLLRLWGNSQIRNEAGSAVVPPWVDTARDGNAKIQFIDQGEWAAEWYEDANSGVPRSGTQRDFFIGRVPAFPIKQAPVCRHFSGMDATFSTLGSAVWTLLATLEPSDYGDVGDDLAIYPFLSIWRYYDQSDTSQTVWKVPIYKIHGTANRTHKADPKIVGWDGV